MIAKSGYCRQSWDLLKRIKPLKTNKDSYAFLNQEGQPLNFHTWRAGLVSHPARSRNQRA